MHNSAQLLQVCTKNCVQTYGEALQQMAGCTAQLTTAAHRPKKNNVGK
jgi:hypothetical protein